MHGPNCRRKEGDIPFLLYFNSYIAIYTHIKRKEPYSNITFFNGRNRTLILQLLAHKFLFGESLRNVKNS